MKHHIQFFDTIFPNYELLADEITAEGNRVIVLARVRGKHEGEFNGIPPTYKMVDFPFAIGYIIDNGMKRIGVFDRENNKIENIYWLR